MSGLYTYEKTLLKLLKCYFGAEEYAIIKVALHGDEYTILEFNPKKRLPFHLGIREGLVEKYSLKLVYNGYQHPHVKPTIIKNSELGVHHQRYSWKPEESSATDAFLPDYFTEEHAMISYLLNKFRTNGYRPDIEILKNRFFRRFGYGNNGRDFVVIHGEKIVYILCDEELHTPDSNSYMHIYTFPEGFTKNSVMSQMSGLLMNIDVDDIITDDERDYWEQTNTNYGIDGQPPAQINWYGAIFSRPHEGGGWDVPEFPLKDFSGIRIAVKYIDCSTLVKRPSF